MRAPSPRALTDRARTLVVQMHSVERWAYAVDSAVPAESVRAAILSAGYLLVEEEAKSPVARYEAQTDRDDADAIVTLRREDLGVTVLQAYGRTTPDRLGPILEATGFVPQSSLLRRAYDVGQDDARKALTTLAHMVVVWDEDWADLFLLHLASPDPIVRHDAVLATVVAALSSREREHARVLLDEARRHEKFPRLADTMTEALAAVERIPSSPTPPARA
jgi:hypothetical protein